MRSVISILLAGFLFAVPDARAQHPDTAALERELPRIMEIGDVPGLSIAVLDGGEISWSGAFGTLGDSAGTPVTEETVFSAASLSKPVFAYVVLRLAERDLIDLDRPLAEVLDGPRITHDPRGRRITPRMVLSHGTGLPNWGGERLELQFDPGTGFNYSGEGYVYLQRVVERTTGLSLEELARREVFEPLGMTRTSYVWRERFAGSAVYGKDWAWRTEHVERYEEPNAAYSLLTTARDYARFVAAVLQGTGLSAESRRLMLTPERPALRASRPTSADDHVSWGLGWGLQRGPAGRAFWHWGDNGRFKAYVVAYPEDGTGVVYLANANDGLSIAEAIVSRVVDDDHRALQWLDYDRHDDPERLAVKSVQRAAVERGAEEALARYRAARTDPENPLGLDATLDLARFLDARDLDAAESSVLEIAARDHPDSARAHRALAEALLEAGDYDAALEAQRRELALAPDDEDARRRARWIEERVTVRDRPVTVPTSRLERYVGVYGPRRVWVEDGILHYRREGNPAHRLVPMAEDLFAVEGLETFRVRFVDAGSGPAGAVEGLYFDGTTDRTEREHTGDRADRPIVEETGGEISTDAGPWRLSFAESGEGARIAYYKVPESPETVPLLVISGGPGTDHRYLHAGGAFDSLARERRVVTFDQRATGRSSPAPETPRIDDWVADVEAVRRSLGADRVDLLGHSFGGYLALSYAADHPERVRRMVLVASAAPDPSDNVQLLEQVYPERAERWRGARASLPDTFPAERIRLFFSMEFADPAWTDRYVDHVRGLRYDVAVNNALRRDMARRELDARVEGIDRPVLLLHGRSDAVLAPVTSWRLHRRLPDSRFRVVERSGHLPFVEQPEAFVEAVLEFLVEGDSRP